MNASALHGQPDTGNRLGMAITRNIVEMMGGTIRCRPRRTEVPSLSSCRCARADRQPPRGKIAELVGLKALVVDDDFNTCDSVAKLLTRVGMRAEWTLSGREAVLRARQSIELGDPRALSSTGGCRT
ncbi:MAG: hypothetical protein ACLVB4_00235 [Butyricicoccus sp.]